jgi:hypothetical protein
VSSGNGPGCENDREQARSRRGRVLEQLKADIAGRELLSSDSLSDHDRRQERRAQKLGEQTPA